ncbi:hypothetical protein FRB99_003380 [Tulasnella sp. 403]|nr:hypothetical protein FRB99_003380 [Tulasnella sp. 403]
MARGEDVGPDPDERAPIGNILRLLVILVVTALYAGYFITGDPWWGYESKWLTMRHWKSLIPVGGGGWFYDGTQKAYTESQLLRYDGTDPEKPILLAIDGTVYDVTEGRRIYGPGGGYHQFAGRDAARAYVTGCFKIHLTHDVRGLTEEEMKSLTKWKDFYANHEKYRKVGTVYHPPIHPSTPIPPPCDSKGDPIIQPQSGPHLPPAASDKSSGEL